MYIKQFKTVVANKKIIFRLLKKNDEKILINFFYSLTDDFKKWYNPHPFDKITAMAICNDKNRKHKKIIGICDGEIVAYCQLFFGLRNWEKIRFEKRDIFFEKRGVCTIAPCIVEKYQNRGFGSKMMEYITNICKQCNKKYILLWGGVVVKNKGAVKYYEKMNFKKTKKWLHPKAKVMSYDMYLEI